MSNPLIWNMNMQDPFAEESARVPPAPFIGSLERDMMNSPFLPPDSTTRGRSLSGSSGTPDLARCPACPSPGLVPPSGMVSHVVSCHRGQGFQCAACKDRENIQFIMYEELREHIRVAHRVSSEAGIQSAIILPVSLVQWRCGLCAGSRLWLSEDLVKDHIVNVHGRFYLKKAHVYCVASCRVCNFDGPILEHLETAHPREAFADQEDLEEDVPDLEIDQQDQYLESENQNDLNTSGRSVSVRSDLFSEVHDRPVSTFQRSLSPLEKVKMSPKSRSSSPEIIIEKEVTVAPRVLYGSIQPKSEKHKKPKRRSSSSSSSSTDSSDSRDGRKKKKRPSTAWVTDINKYLQGPKPNLTKSAGATALSSSPSPGPTARSRSRHQQERELSPGELTPSPRKYRRTKSRSRRSRSNSSPSNARNYTKEKSRHTSRSPVSKRPCPSRKWVTRTPRKRNSRTPPKRRSGSRNLRSSSRTPPRRRSPLSKKYDLPPRRSRESSRPDSRHSRTPPRNRSRSRSSSIEYNREQSHATPGKRGNRRKSDSIRCSICGISCVNKHQFIEHQMGQRHREAAARARGEIESGTTSTGRSRPTDTSGNFQCVQCKGAFIVRHYHCNLCGVHSTSYENHKQHLEGKKHCKLSGGSKTEVHPSPEVHDLTKPSTEKHCPKCAETFVDISDLTDHVREEHDFFITCKECKVLKHPPVIALTCTELLNHLVNDHHKTNVTDLDLKYYGEVSNWKQGYVKCKLCPPMKLGNLGLWLDNEVNTLTIRKHFSSYHSKHTFHAMSYLILGCQLCSFTHTSDKTQAWQNHLATHLPVQEQPEQIQQTTPGVQKGTTSACGYCSAPVQTAEEQSHIGSHHMRLTFRCKLCPVADRYLYKDYVDIERHLKLKHSGNSLHENIFFPGDKKNMQDFAWVKCKTYGCEFKGLGLGKEVKKHLSEKHRGGGLQDFNIFCRICDQNENSIDNYDDAEDFQKHMKQVHSDIIERLPPAFKDWQKGSNLGIGV